MIIAIIGSRAYPDLGRVQAYVARIARKYPDAVIVSGGAKGVDKAAESAAKASGLTVSSFRPVQVEDGYAVDRLTIPARGFVTRTRIQNTRTLSKYEKWGQAAYARNLEIVDAADIVVAFQCDDSKGTQHGIDYARAQNKPLYAY